MSDFSSLYLVVGQAPSILEGLVQDKNHVLMRAVIMLNTSNWHKNDKMEVIHTICTGQLVDFFGVILFIIKCSIIAMTLLASHMHVVILVGIHVIYIFIR